MTDRSAGGRTTAGGPGVIRVLLADDQALAIAGLRLILSADEGFEVVQECQDGAQVLDRYPLARADVIVMDVRMPHLDGAQATARLRKDPSAPPVLILTTFGEDEVLSAALRAGASGFLLKDAPGEEIIRAVRTVAAGGAYLDPQVTHRVLAGYRHGAVVSPDGVLEALTAREREVLRLIGRGRTNEEIASALFIAEATVKTHVSHLFDKLGLRDRAAAIVFSFDHGMVRPGEDPGAE